MITENELNALSQIIDECRNLTALIKVKCDVNLSYVLSELYAKVLLTMCEIYTLLVYGYPEGSMALSRTIYETMIIMTYLNENKDDLDLIKRFHDDYKIKTCADHIKFLKWLIDNEKGDENVHKLLSERTNEFNQLSIKYSHYANYTNDKSYTYFTQYWWAGKNMSFNRLTREVGYPNNYLYDISCYRVHAGMCGAIRLDNSEEGLLIGSCENGKELPMTFSILSFEVCTKIYFDLHNKDVSSVLTRMTQLLKLIKLS